MPSFSGLFSPATREAVTSLPNRLGQKTIGSVVSVNNLMRLAMAGFVAKDIFDPERNPGEGHLHATARGLLGQAINIGGYELGSWGGRAGASALLRAAAVRTGLSGAALRLGAGALGFGTGGASLALMVGLPIAYDLYSAYRDQSTINPRVQEQVRRKQTDWLARRAMAEASLDDQPDMPDMPDRPSYLSDEDQEEGGY